MSEPITFDERLRAHVALGLGLTSPEWRAVVDKVYGKDCPITYEEAMERTQKEMEEKYPEDSAR